MDYAFFMAKAYALAEMAFACDEVPIGCVIVREGQIIGSGYNRRNSDKNSLYHAEILAIDEACKHVGDWRLEDCTLFVTIEPCPMCAGAIVISRIPTVVYGAANPKAGCAGSILNILNEPRFNHRADVVPGVMGTECGELMSRFFLRFRQNQAVSAAGGEITNGVML